MLHCTIADEVKRNLFYEMSLFAMSGLCQYSNEPPGTLCMSDDQLIITPMHICTN